MVNGTLYPVEKQPTGRSNPIENAALTSTLKRYSSLSEYANQQGAPESAYIQAGWYKTTHQGRPALAFSTLTGTRYRFIDGAPKLSKYTSPNGYQRCFYRLPEAVAIAQASGQPLFICNGEAGTVASQYHGLAATCITGGENANISDELLTQLQAAWSGAVIIAFDCDNTGRTFAPKHRTRLQAAGYNVRAVDLQLGEKGDLADFCKLHGSNALDALLTAPELPFEAAPVKPIIQRRETSAVASDGAVDWESERRRWWLDRVIPTVESNITARRGKHFRCINPSHPDRNPSARISTTKDTDGLYVCTCGSHSRETVARWLGLDFMEWWLTERAPLFPRQPKATPDSQADWETLPNAILSSILRCYSRVAPLFYIVVKSGLRVFNREQIKAIAMARGMSKAKFEHDWPLLFLPSLSLLECIGEDNMHSKTYNCRVKPRFEVVAQLRELEAIRVNVAYHPTGAPPKFGDEDTRVVPIQTAAMIRDSGIDENADVIAAELNEALQPAFAAQDHAERKARKAAIRGFRRICDSFDDSYETPIPDDAQIHTLPMLRTAYLNAYVSEHDGELLSRAEIRRLIGCSDSAIKAISARANVTAKAADELPTLDIHSAADIERITPYGRTVKGFPVGIVYTTPSGQEVQRGVDARNNSEGMQEICTMAINSGAIGVKVLYQTAKEYHVQGAPLPTKERVVMEVSEGNTPKERVMIDTSEQVESEPTDPRKYPRRWLVGQYQLALERMGWKRDGFGVHDSQGEYAPDNPRALIELILGRSLVTVSSDVDPDYYERPPTEYELNARHDWRQEAINAGFTRVVYP